VLNKEGIETEMIQLAEKIVKPCIGCRKCMAKKNRRCSITNDAANECIEKMLSADGIIMATPVYFSDVSAQLKALIDRAGYVARANDDMLKHKVGAAVIAMRRGGAIGAFDTINRFFMVEQMIVHGAHYFNFAMGRDIGDVEKDVEGLGNLRLVAENMIWLLRKVNG
jgi:multimeric flavodoxin WrbA